MKRLFLACTPRTGNLWFRKMLAASLGIQNVAAHSPEEVPWRDLPTDCLVAMHWHYSDGFAAFLRSQGFSSIVTMRNPLDVLISILQFSKHEPATARWLNGEGGDERGLACADPTSPEFLQYALSERAAALLGISSEWAPHALSVVRYEELVECSETVLTRVLREVGETAVVPLSDVIAQNTMERLRPVSKHHFWRGEPGLWRKLLTQEFCRAISARHAELMAVTGYDHSHATAPSAEAVRELWEKLSDTEAGGYLGANKAESARGAELQGSPTGTTPSR